MGNFNRGGGRSGGGGFGRSFGGGNRFGGGGRDGGRGGGRPTMHKAVCSECGTDCEVPFRPTGDRPVFCNACFDKQGGSDRPNKFEGGRRDKPHFGDKPMFDATCGKCGKNCQVPFRPMAGKPVYCNDCFDKDGGKGGRDSGEIMTQLKMLNSKLETLIRALAPNTPNLTPKKTETLGGVKEAPVKEITKEKKLKVKAKAKVAVKKPVAKKKK